MNNSCTSLRPAILYIIMPAVLYLAQLSSGYSQCLTSQQSYTKLVELEKSALPDAEKLAQIKALEKSYKKCRLPEDSVYARMLHRIGVLNNGTGNISDAISYTKRSLRINMNGNISSNRKLALYSSFNLGVFYLIQNFYTEALPYFELCIQEGKEAKDSATVNKVSAARQKKGYICHQMGDDKKDLTEATRGLKSALLFRNTKVIVDLYNERAQANASLQQFPAAIADLDDAMKVIPANDFNAYADNHKLRALIYAANGKRAQALMYYKKAIEARGKTDQQTMSAKMIAANSAKDYLDAGSFFMDTLCDYINSRNYYRKALALAQESDDAEDAGKALNNMGIISLRTKNYANALKEYHQGLLEIIPAFSITDPLQNPSNLLFSTVNKVFLYQLLSNKAECLLYLYKQTNDKKYLSATLATALLTDSVITGMRHEQTEEQSKLHWLKDARDIFTNALEACYLADNYTLAFYFMEKSRSVLLNDKLNELGANAILPPADAAKEREYIININSAQQQLSRLAGSDPLFNEQENRYFEAKEKFESYVKDLQTRYPAYYQYKYADDVPSLRALQQYLNRSGQCFIHYFISDTCIYILVTTPQSGKITRQSVKSISSLTEFVNICSDRRELNKDYSRFAGLSAYLYSVLLQPLQLPLKRIIICNDNFLLPFEALTTDAKGKDFLVHHYAFSYAYSARSLMKKTDNPPGNGNCLLVSPASFDSSLGVNNLNQSEKLLEKPGAYYSNTKLLQYNDATKKTFLKQLPRYTIVGIYSHASADSSDTEPVLYMQDSVIRLSELETLYRPSTKLVILSACQTSVGKNATGEGIYSLARGFAAAGIPSIATTLWKADESAMYAITEMFHQKISQGMRKDEALQQAKLAYMQQGNDDHLLPYYWATMILAGDAAPVELIKTTEHRWWMVIVLVFLLGIGLIWWVRRKVQTNIITPVSQTASTDPPVFGRC